MATPNAADARPRLVRDDAPAAAPEADTSERRVPSLVWVLLGEIFPNRFRARALGLAAAAQWVANFLITVTFPALADFSLFFTYGMYASFAVLSFLFVFWKVPETNGMSLEESEMVFARKGSAKRSAVASG